MGMFSLEMPKSQLLERILYGMAGINSDDIRLDFQSAPVAKRVCFLPAVHEHHVRMAAVKPEHAVSPKKL